MIYAPTQQCTIATLNPAHRSIDISLYARLLRALLHNERAEYRSEGQGCSHRNNEGDSYHPTHCAEQHTCHTLDHRERQEHCERCERRSDNRDTHLLGSKDCRLLNACTSIDVSGDILQHHNSVIHHHTNRDRNRRHRDNVERRVGHQEVYQRREHRDRDGEHNDKHRTPAAEHQHNHEHNHDEGDEDGIDQRLSRIHNVVRHIDIWLDSDIRRESLTQLLQLLVHLARNLDSVSIGLLLDNHHTTAGTIIERLLSTLLLSIANGSDITKVDIGTIACTYHNVEHLLGTSELLIYTQRVGIRTYIHLATRQRDILRCDNLRNLLDSKAISLELVRVAVDLNLTLRNTRHRNCTYAIDTSQRCGYTLVDNFIQSAPRLLCLDRHKHNRHLLGRELEDDRLIDLVGKDVRGDVEFVTDICSCNIRVDTILELERYDRDILLRLRMDMFEILDTIEGILQRSSHILLDIYGTRTRIGGDDHNIGSLDMREEVDWQLQQRENTKNRDCDKDKYCRYRIIY